MARRRQQSPVIRLLSILAVGLAVLLIALLAWLGLRDAPTAEVGEGRYRDAANTYTFEVPDGWGVMFEDGATVVRYEGGGLPAYRLTTRRIEDVGLLASWNCDLLPGFVPEMARRVSPWEGASLVYQVVPCATDPAQPAHVQLYMALDNDRRRLGMLLLGPLDGVTWLIAETDPFEGDWPESVVDAMLQTVTTARRN